MYFGFCWEWFFSFFYPVLIYTRRLLVMQGNILYRFPSLQRTASQKSKRKEYVGRKWADWIGGVEKFFKERSWQFRFSILFFSYLLFVISIWLFNGNMGQCSFSKTSSSERAMVIGLGGLNLFGVIVLGTMLKYALHTTY